MSGEERAEERMHLCNAWLVLPEFEEVHKYRGEKTPNFVRKEKTK